MMRLFITRDKALFEAQHVSLLGNSSALKHRPWSIFIDFLGFRVYLGVNRTRHASEKLVFHCAPGGSFFDQFTITSSTYALAGE